MELKIKYVSDLIGTQIPAPAYASRGAAGLDLPACVEQAVAVGPGERVTVPTGIAIALPSKDYVGLVYVRSSLGFKRGITLSNSVGVIDSDYRGQIFVALTNLSQQEYVIQPGERIAQLVVTPVCMPRLSVVDDLPETERGEGGIGSTGRM